MDEPEESPECDEPSRTRTKEPVNDESLWKQSTEIDTKGRDEEFDEYLADLLL